MLDPVGHVSSWALLTVLVAANKYPRSARYGRHSETADDVFRSTQMWWTQIGETKLKGAEAELFGHSLALILDEPERLTGMPTETALSGPCCWRRLTT
jgi:hypothetical protein